MSAMCRFTSLAAFSVTLSGGAAGTVYGWTLTVGGSSVWGIETGLQGIGPLLAQVLARFDEACKLSA